MPLTPTASAPNLLIGGTCRYQETVIRSDSFTTSGQALIFRGDEQVASGPTGARIVVEPGAYLVRVGSGPTSQMVSLPVDVQAGVLAIRAMVVLKCGLCSP